MTEPLEDILSNPTIIAGPCVYEVSDTGTSEHPQQLANSIKSMCDDVGFNLIFKMSFDKANRTSIDSYRGFGIDPKQRVNNVFHVFNKIRNDLGVMTITDIHEPWQAEIIAGCVDIIQIPALLSRQTDLIVAAAKTGKIVNIKKGQFTNPKDMIYAADKVKSVGNNQVIITDRGTSFGYNDVVIDFRSIMDLHRLGLPVCVDITHPTQRPSGGSGKSTGDWEYAKVFGPAAAAAGADLLFMEVHDDPANAKSDGPNSIPRKNLNQLLYSIKQVWNR